MPIKVRCPGCQKGLSAPDAAAGKSLRCPHCQTKIRVPGGAGEEAAAPPERVTTKARPQAKSASQSLSESSSFIEALDKYDFADRHARVCPKCGVEVGEEDIECPSCFVNLKTGELSAVRKKKLARKGPDPDEFYKTMRQSSWAFFKDNQAFVWRTFGHLLWGSLLAFACFWVAIWCAKLPPAWFMAALGSIFLLLCPGWMFYLHVEVIRNTLARKKKMQRVNYNFFENVAFGMKTLIWPLIAVFPIHAVCLGIAAILIGRERGEIALPLMALPFLCCIPLFPIAMSHMAMPVENIAWMPHKLLPQFWALKKPAIYWSVFAVLVMAPAIGCFAAIGAVSGQDIQEYVHGLNENSLIASAKKTKEPKRGGVEEEWLKEYRNKPEVQTDITTLGLPIGLWLGGLVFTAMGSVYLMRANGVFAYYFPQELDLVAKEDEADYVATELEFADEEPRTSSVGIVFGLMAFNMVGWSVRGTMSGELMLVLYGLVMSLVTYVPTAGMWRIFEKAHEPGWAAIIPIYRWVVFCRVAKRPWWWGLIVSIPLFGFPLEVLSCLTLAKRFGRTTNFAIGLCIPIINLLFYTALGLGHSQCLKPKSKSKVSIYN